MRFATIFLALGLVATARPLPADEGRAIAVGVASVDITPEGPILLNGFLSRNLEESKGTQIPIKAVALAIGSDEQGPSIVLTVDNLGIPDAMVADLAARLKQKAGIARERLAVGSSHTHTAPCLPGVAPNIFGKPFPPEKLARVEQYGRDLIDKLEEACLAALKDRRPAFLARGKGKADFAMNRRTKGGPVDHDLPMLRAVDSDGKVRAVLIAYACHCTTLNGDDNLISPDWAGEARLAIEADNPGATALVLIGCGADSNPKDRPGPNIAHRHGQAIGAEVARLLKGPLTPINDPPVGKIARIKLPFDTLPTREELEALAAKGGPPGHNATIQLARLDRDGALQPDIDYVVQSWNFGDDLEIVFLAGEVVVDYALRIKSELDPERTWTVAYANDVPCYIPSERILREGGYEGGGAMVYYARPTRLKPGVEQLILDAVHEIVPDSFEAKKAAEIPPIRSPAEGLASILVKPGLRVELVAAEPLVLDPVAIDWGGDGKLWVAEMLDYPSGSDGDYKPGGRVSFLEDLDGDGRFDKATRFLGGLPFPTGVMAWRKGVLICAAPDIIYAEDLDGDGQADRREVLYRGFATENYQARVNGLAYGLDNWVYGANGLIGGTIRGERTGKEVILGGRDFRIQPDVGIFEPASGLTQQGRVRDDWGNPFGGNNSIWIQHYPLPDHYARRNQHVASPGPSVYVPRDPENRRVFPASEPAERYNHPESLGQVTSACSPLIHRDPTLGVAYLGNAFICEPVHNAVHREVVSADGVTFAGHRAEDEQASEFLASTDHWFRPVQVRTGPDGALYVVDMYRHVIEHPRWISPDRLATLDVRAGADKGRIYRVVREGQAPQAIPILDRRTTPDLARAIDSPNGTLRDLVQRLLVHRMDASASPILIDLARSSPRAVVRMQALCTLDGLGSLTPDLIRAGLVDRHPGVREQAVRLAEGRIGSDPEIGPALLALADDPEIRVRYQLALSLGEWDDPRAGRALGRLAVRDASDSWVRAAVHSSSVRRTGEILAVVMAAELDPAYRSSLVEPLVATLASTGTTEALAGVIEAIVEPVGGSIPPWRLALLASLLDSGRRSTELPGALRSKADRLARAYEAARGLALQERADLSDRVSAIRLLGRDDPASDADLDRLADLLGPRQPLGVQSAALGRMARLRDPGIPDRILARWPGLVPSLRVAAIDAILDRPEWTPVVLSRLESGAIRPGEVDAAHRQRLLSLADGSLQARASKLFAGTEGRAQVVAAYRESLGRAGNPIGGERVFARLCAGCHKLGGKGHAVGPDLEALTDTSAEALAVAILDPNREVDARYFGYDAATTDGRVFSGLIASETGNALTLKRQDDQSDVILRADLEELKNSGRSLMPEGLERDLSRDDLADLIAYLDASNRPKDLPGNRPRTIAQDANGSLHLLAESAAIFGETLTFEPEFGNLGYWHSPSDRAIWTLRVDRLSTFTVTFDYACADEAAGDSFLIRANGTTTRGTIGSTGSWSDYRSLFVREMTLPAGTHRLEVRPAGPIRGALLDLRSVTLTPRPPQN
ncbi:PVC-type heme-binding CxxCH protein [Tundrisphaera lichenicola]|uniref:PVC-type heme-binding CxxCH protein n=1 Tax=Tundrisphaera lichenicola TaxID=2029860 RepID=UPI003EBB9A6A